MTNALLCLVLVSMLPTLDPEVSTDVSRTYQELRAKTGRSADDQVQLALWCESHGLARERLHHLSLAVLSDPSNTKARGLMGLVGHDGRYQSPEKVVEQAVADRLLVKYHEKRSAAPENAEAHWALGVWAEKQGLADQARAHFIAVTRLEPSRSDAWKRLGYRLHEGRWLTNAQLDLERSEAEARKQADRIWRPRLETWRKQLASASQRSEAEAGLAGVDDPRAVRSIVRVFGGDGSLQPKAVQLLAQIDAPSSSRALAVLAYASRLTDVSRAATETLRARDPREYADLLIGLLDDPIRFEVKPVRGPNLPGELLVEGKRANVRRVYAPPSPIQPGDQLGINIVGERVIFRPIEPGHMTEVFLGDLLGTSRQDPWRLPRREILTSPREIFEALRFLEGSTDLRPGFTWFRVRFGDTAEIPVGQMVAEAQKSIAATNRVLHEDEQMLEQHNVAVRIANEKAAGVLSGATGQALAANRRAWTRWYLERVGYASQPTDWRSRASFTEPVEIAYRPPVLPENSTRQAVGYDWADCFVAGTPVQTIVGPRSIDSLKIGDMVLSQSTANGALSYRPVLATHHNPALATCRVKLRGEEIVSSQVHRFWIVGRGWLLARDLKTGDPVRTLDGVSLVESVEPGIVQPVYNLEVADDADYFAGASAALVHDNTLPDPRLVPFDACPALKVSIRPGNPNEVTSSK